MESMVARACSPAAKPTTLARARVTAMNTASLPKYPQGPAGTAASKTRGAAAYRIPLIRNRWRKAERLVSASPAHIGTPLT